MENNRTTENLVQLFCSSRSRLLNEFSVGNKRSALVFCEDVGASMIFSFSEKIIPSIGMKILDHYNDNPEAYEQQLNELESVLEQ